ncbi:hypothetical protein B0H16DRAFT_775451 [Mycena metata]|uniref:Uncharacterized protein n=1 Tax=Mycena metata TaxID=1033252 RepID=A0AAD7NA46_9AGAR|nr:hypothetical protein B0H16DRAFT_775451 [Mycena metata]
MQEDRRRSGSQLHNLRHEIHVRRFRPFDSGSAHSHVAQVFSYCRPRPQFRDTPQCNRLYTRTDGEWFVAAQATAFCNRKYAACPLESGSVHSLLSFKSIFFPAGLVNYMDLRLFYSGPVHFIQPDPETRSYVRNIILHRWLIHTWAVHCVPWASRQWVCPSVLLDLGTEAPGSRDLGTAAQVRYSLLPIRVVISISIEVVILVSLLGYRH